MGTGWRIAVSSKRQALQQLPVCIAQQARMGAPPTPVCFPLLGAGNRCAASACIVA